MKAVIVWLVHNPVAANLFMWILSVGVALTFPTIYRAAFSNVAAFVIQGRVTYLGAKPEDGEGVLPCVPVLFFFA